jgi:hypothetical protein
MPAPIRRTCRRLRLSACLLGDALEPKEPALFLGRVPRQRARISPPSLNHWTLEPEEPTEPEKTSYVGVTAKGDDLASPRTASGRLAEREEENLNEVEEVLEAGRQISAKPTAEAVRKISPALARCDLSASEVVSRSAPTHSLSGIWRWRAVRDLNPRPSDP